MLQTLVYFFSCHRKFITVVKVNQIYRTTLLHQVWRKTTNVPFLKNVKAATSTAIHRRCTEVLFEHLLVYQGNKVSIHTYKLGNVWICKCLQNMCHRSSRIHKFANTCAPFCTRPTGVEEQDKAKQSKSRKKYPPTSAAFVAVSKNTIIELARPLGARPHRSIIGYRRPHIREIEASSTHPGQTYRGGKQYSLSSTHSIFK